MINTTAYTIELWMHLGGLQSTQEAKVALGYLIPSDQFDPECLPFVEATDLVSYLVLETSYYTKQQLKCHKSLEAYI